MAYNTYVCRVCSNGPVYDDTMVAPCNCGGAQRWVHSRCLEAWRAKADDPHRCDQCGTPLQLLRPHEDQLRRRRRAWWKPVAAIVGVGLLALGGFLWAEAAEQRRQKARRRREARERRERMREFQRLAELCDKELQLLVANWALLVESARQGQAAGGQLGEAVKAAVEGAQGGAGSGGNSSSTGRRGRRKKSNGGSGGGSSGASIGHPSASSSSNGSSSGSSVGGSAAAAGAALSSILQMAGEAGTAGLLPPTSPSQQPSLLAP